MEMLHQHLEKLSGFRSVARNGSFLKGAEETGVSQPALTKSVRNLEESLGVQLLIRHQRGVRLTESGEQLLRFCEKLFSELPDLEARVRRPTKMSGVLRIGSYETLGILFWPDALSALAKLYPNLQIQITTSDPQTLWRRLDEGILNMIVDAEPPVSERYFSKVLYTDRFGLFFRNDFAHRFKTDQELPMSYVPRAWDQGGKSLRELLDGLHLKHQLLYDFESFVSVRAAIEAGLAIGVLPVAFAHRNQRKNILTYSTNGKPFYFGEHRICVTYLDENRKDARIVEVSRVLRTAAKAFAY